MKDDEAIIYVIHPHKGVFIKYTSSDVPMQQFDETYRFAEDANGLPLFRIPREVTEINIRNYSLKTVAYDEDSPNDIVQEIFNNITGRM